MYPEKDDPLFLLLDAMSGGNPSDAIVRSEKRGQQKLVKSDVLPKKFNSGTREQFENMGIVFGDSADDLSCYVTLPKGWKKVATDHDMWSKLLDNKGRERASIFYKAAYYDRDAFISINRRYSYGSRPSLGYDNPKHREGGWIGVATDMGDIIYKTDEIEPEPRANEDRDKWLKWHDKERNLSVVAKEWLTANYPDWENPLAYWD